MGKTLKISPIAPTKALVDGQEAEQILVTSGEKRTLIISVKSDYVTEDMHRRLQSGLQSALAGEGIKVIVLVMSPEDSFEIHEVVTE